jgi:hypothetical protein
MRGVEMTKAELRGYVAVLSDEEPGDVWDALAALWRDADRRAMPTPGNVKREIRKQARAAYARRDLLPEPQITDEDRAAARRHIDEWKRTSPLFGGAE